MCFLWNSRRLTVKEIWRFRYDFEGDFVCLEFLQFWCNVAMLFIVHLFVKTDSTVICVPCMLEHVCYEPFSFKNCRFRRYLMLID